MESNSKKLVFVFFSLLLAVIFFLCVKYVVLDDFEIETEETMTEEENL